MTIQKKPFLPELAAHLFTVAKETGGKAPSERDLAEHFSVSRGQVREALAILEAMQMIERRAKSGIYLRRDNWGLETMAFYARAGIALDPKQIFDAVEVRRIHETSAAEMAAERATEENFSRIREILEESERRIADGRGLAGPDQSFHLEIVRATQNTVFFQICTSFYELSKARLPIYFGKSERSQKSHFEHCQIFEALVARDARLAKALMNSHLRGASSYWSEILDANRK